MAARRLAVTSSSLHALLASLQSHNGQFARWSSEQTLFSFARMDGKKTERNGFFLRMKKGKDSSKTRRESRVIDPDTESESESLGGESESSRKSRFGDSSATRVRVI